MNYYNENDKYCAQWLRNLIKVKLIPEGLIDDRSISEVQADDLKDFAQCHFFAGIGGWARALELAGWEPERPCWTGSCPCQPFSAAGARLGTADERHLWPVWFELIRQCHPSVVFGEQVASADVVGKVRHDPAGAPGGVWFDGVCADLEGAGYTGGASVLGAHSVGAPHIRQRLWWVALSPGERLGQERAHGSGRAERSPAQERPSGLGLRGASGTVAHNECAGLEERAGFAGDIGAQRPPFERDRGPGGVEIPGHERGPRQLQRIGREFGEGPSPNGSAPRAETERSGDLSGLDDAADSRRPQAREHGSGSPPRPARPAEHGGASAVALPDGGFSGDRRVQRGGEYGFITQDSSLSALDLSAREQVGRAGLARQDGPGFWERYDLIACLDGKARRIEPGSQPLVDGTAFKLGLGGTYEGRSRTGMLRGYGNAIVPPVGAQFVRAVREVIEGGR